MSNESITNEVLEQKKVQVSKEASLKNSDIKREEKISCSVSEFLVT